MKTVFKTADGVYFDNFIEARRHEASIIDSKRGALRNLKVYILPRAQEAYNTDKAKLKQFLKDRKNVNKRLSKQEYHYQLGILEMALGNDLRYLKYEIAEYRKLKIELDALTK